jgi:predicted dienelactone hydrolase
VVALSTLPTANRDVQVLYPARPGSEVGKPRATYDIRETLRDPTSPPLSSDPEQFITLPAYRDLPPAPGRFPVVLFSHGYGATPVENVTLQADLAAWGFVVIVPDHVERDTVAVVQGRATVNDLRDALVLRSALNVTAANARLSATLDRTRVAAVGYSQGGATALTALALPEVDTAVAWASVAPPRGRPLAKKPAMLIGAQHDLDYGTDVQRKIYASLTGPGRLVLLGGGAGHATFADDCANVRDIGELIPGGDVKSADNQLLDLAQNGCFPDEVDPRLAWPVITHFTVAQLRSVFGIDRTPVGLGDAISSAFPGVPLVYAHRP